MESVFPWRNPEGGGLVQGCGTEVEGGTWACEKKGGVPKSKKFNGGKKIAGRNPKGELDEGIIFVHMTGDEKNKLIQYESESWRKKKILNRK